MSISPIALFVYNRLRHTVKTVESIRKNTLAKDSNLFVFSDGYKEDGESKRAVLNVRDYINTIDGFNKITIIESATNKGLANSIIRGVTELVDKYGKVIVLEDDLVTSPYFLKFMNEALDAYKNELQVMQISGHMFDVKIKVETDAVFMPFITSWGWASWKRAWDHFDPSMSGYEKVRNDTQLKYQFDLEGTYNYFAMLERQLHGLIDSWAIRWYLSVFLKNGLTLYPVTSFIRNIGFDGSGTHCDVSGGEKEAPPFTSFGRKAFHFPKVTIDRDAYSNVKLFLSSRRIVADEQQSISGRKTFLTRLSNFFSL